MEYIESRKEGGYDCTRHLFCLKSESTDVGAVETVSAQAYFWPIQNDYMFLYLKETYSHYYGQMMYKSKFKLEV